MAMSPEEAQRARMQASLDRGLRSPGTALAVDNRPNFTMGGNGEAPRPAPSVPAVDRRPNFTMGGNGPLPPEPGKVPPRNPSLRTAAQAAAAADITDTVGKPTTKAGKFGYAAAKGLRALGPAATGAAVVSNFNDYKIDDPDLDSSAMGTMRYLRDGEFGKAGRSASKGLLETGMDLGSFAADAADVVLPGQPASQAYKKALRSTFGEQLVDNTQPIAGSAQEPPPSLRAPQVTQSQVRAAEPQEPATPSNVVTVRNGNQFSGEGVKEGFSYDGAPRAGLTSMPADNFASVSPALDRQRAEAMAQLTPAQAAAALGDPGYSRGATPGMGGFGGATLSSAANERFNYAGLPEREKDRQATLRTAQMQADARRYEADAQEQSGLRADATTRRGQDLDLLGREADARTSLRSTERANEKDAFDRTLKIAEFDTKRADTALAQQQSAEKSWQSAVENRFRDPADPTKPDTRKVAAFNTAVDATIPSLADQLEKSGQGAVAADLRKRGRAALGPAELNELQQLFELRELSLQTDGWALGSSGAVMSDDLLGYRPRGAGGVQKNLIGSDTVVTANGTKIRRDKLVYGPDGNAILPDFGVPRTDFRRYYDQPTNR